MYGMRIFMVGCRSGATNSGVNDNAAEENDEKIIYTRSALKKDCARGEKQQHSHEQTQNMDGRSKALLRRVQYTKLKGLNLI